MGAPKYQTLSAILGPPSGNFGFYSYCSVAGDEQVPPALLGWYLIDVIGGVVMVFLAR